MIEATATGDTPTAPWRVLLADPSPRIREGLARQLVAVDPSISFAQARDLREVRSALWSEPVALAFLDATLPGLDHPARLAELASAPGAPCLVVTAEALGPHHHDLALSGGAYELLEKPVETDELRRLVASRARMRRPSRVVVADPSKAFRRLIQRIMSQSRFSLRVDVVESGEAAIASLKRESAEVAFLDFAMRGIDGLEAACIIQESMPAVRVVMLTASRNPAIGRAARYFGVVDVLHKPFYVGEVDRALHGAFGLALPRLAATDSGAAA